MTTDCRFANLKLTLAAMLAASFFSTAAWSQAPLPEIGHPAGGELSYLDSSCEPTFRGGDCHDYSLDLWTNYCHERRTGFRAPIRPYCGLGLGCRLCLLGSGCHSCASSCVNGGCASCSNGSCGVAQPVDQPAVAAPQSTASDSSGGTAKAEVNAPAVPATESQGSREESSADEGDSTPDAAPVPADVSSEEAAEPIVPPQDEPAETSEISIPDNPLVPTDFAPEPEFPRNIDSRPIPRNITLPTPEVKRESKRLVPTFNARYARKGRGNPVAQDAQQVHGTTRLIQQLEELSR